MKKNHRCQFGLAISQILPTVATSFHVVEIYRKFVRYRGLACRKEKGEIGCLKKEIGVIVPQVFQERSHAGYAHVGRNDPPTHSCRRSVVDDNGNPIFQNNICLEDRRLRRRHGCWVCTCAYARACTEYSISTVTFIPSFHSLSDVNIRIKLRKVTYCRGMLISQYATRKIRKI